MFRLFGLSNFIYGLSSRIQRNLSWFYSVPRGKCCDSTRKTEMKVWSLFQGSDISWLVLRTCKILRIWSFHGDWMQWSVFGQSAVWEWSCNPTFWRLSLLPSSGRMSSLMIEEDSLRNVGLQFSSHTAAVREGFIASRSEILLLVKASVYLRWTIEGSAEVVQRQSLLFLLSSFFLCLFELVKDARGWGCVKLTREWGAKWKGRGWKIWIIPHLDVKWNWRYKQADEDK
jgi:hypothetical protein